MLSFIHKKQTNKNVADTSFKNSICLGGASKQSALFSKKCIPKNAPMPSLSRVGPEKHKLFFKDANKKDVLSGLAIKLKDYIKTNNSRVTWTKNVHTAAL